MSKTLLKSKIWRPEWEAIDIGRHSVVEMPIFLKLKFTNITKFKKNNKRVFYLLKLILKFKSEIKGRIAKKIIKAL